MTYLLVILLWGVFFVIIGMLLFRRIRRPSPTTAEDTHDPAQRSKWPSLRPSSILLAAIVFGIGTYESYTLLTEIREERAKETESRAAAQLQSFRFQGAADDGKTRPETVQLKDNSWGRVYYQYSNMTTSYKPSGDPDFPFTGTVTFDKKTFATISHATKDAAESDNDFYWVKTEDGKFAFKKNRAAYLKNQPSAAETITKEFRYDRETSRWILQ